MVHSRSRLACVREFCDPVHNGRGLVRILRRVVLTFHRRVRGVGQGGGIGVADISWSQQCKARNQWCPTTIVPFLISTIYLPITTIMILGKLVWNQRVVVCDESMLVRVVTKLFRLKPICIGLEPRGVSLKPVSWNVLDWRQAVFFGDKGVLVFN